MKWEFRLAVKEVITNGQTFELYGLVEHHFEGGNHKGMVSDFIDPNGWEDLEDLKATLEYMLEATNKPVLVKFKGEDVIWL